MLKLSSLKSVPESVPAWTDVVDDYLEVHAALDCPSRRFLIDRLRRCRIRAREIRPLSAFAISGHQVVVGPHQSCQARWFYDPKTRKLRRQNRQDFRNRKTDRSEPGSGWQKKTY